MSGTRTRQTLRSLAAPAPTASGPRPTYRINECPQTGSVMVARNGDDWALADVPLFAHHVFDRNPNDYLPVDRRPQPALPSRMATWRWRNRSERLSVSQATLSQFIPACTYPCRRTGYRARPVVLAGRLLVIAVLRRRFAGRGIAAYQARRAIRLFHLAAILGKRAIADFAIVRSRAVIAHHSRIGRSTARTRNLHRRCG